MAAELNEAYVRYEPLAGDIRNRIMAVARAPLRDRIQQLRIAMRDPNNGVWLEDLREWERVRHGQIQTTAEIVAKRGDADTLAELEAELLAPDWRESPAPGDREKSRGPFDEDSIRSGAKMRLEIEPGVDAFLSGIRRATGPTVHMRWNACFDLLGCLLTIQSWRMHYRL